MNGFLPFKALATTSATTDTPSMTLAEASSPSRSKTGALGLLGKYSSTKGGDERSLSEHSGKEDSSLSQIEAVSGEKLLETEAYDPQEPADRSEQEPTDKGVGNDDGHNSDIRESTGLNRTLSKDNEEESATEAALDNTKPRGQLRNTTSSDAIETKGEDQPTGLENDDEPCVENTGDELLPLSPLGETVVADNTKQASDTSEALELDTKSEGGLLSEEKSSGDTKHTIKATEVAPIDGTEVPEEVSTASQLGEKRELVQEENETPTGFLVEEDNADDFIDNNQNISDNLPPAEAIENDHLSPPNHEDRWEPLEAPGSDSDSELEPSNHLQSTLEPTTSDGRIASVERGSDLIDITPPLSPTRAVFSDLVDDQALPAIQEYELSKPQEAPKEAAPKPNPQSHRPKHTPQVDLTQQYQQLHRPFDFQTFLNQLRKKSADPIVRYIRLFLVNMARQGHTLSAEQRVKTVAEFKRFVAEKFDLFEPFASMDATDRENSREGLEKLVMNRLYEHCFPPEVVSRHPDQLLPHQFTEDLQADTAFEQQLEKHSWLNSSHLDIDVASAPLDFIDVAVTELNKINRYRAPRDKLICILNSCKIIFLFLKAAGHELNADAFIPLLILVIVKAKTPHLVLNVHYIEHYRGLEWLHSGETLYYLLSLQAAMAFLGNLTAADLTIDQAEYEAHMEAWDAEQKQRAAPRLIAPQPQRSAQPEGMSPSNVLMTLAGMFTKSISQFLSPLPLEEPQQLQRVAPMPHPGPSEQQPAPQLSDDHINACLARLLEMFADMDAALLKDLIVINEGNLEPCIDQCLAMVNET